MKSCYTCSARAVIVLLALSPLLPAFQDQPQSDKNAPADQSQSLQGSIAGVVLDAGQGKPVKDVSLLLARTSGTALPASAKSDEEGHFVFKNLDAGSYMLIGDHPKYARQTYGSRNGLLGGTLLTLGTGQEMKDVSFKLQPNAVASGRVLDEDREPMQGVMVAALKGLYMRGKRQFLPVGTGVTNDLGEYRIANLAPGRYFISATVMNAAKAVIKAAGEAPEEAYVTTYYANATDVSGAAPVEVTAGSDAAGMDIRLAKAKSVHVKGKVMGAPKDQSVTVRLVPKDGGLLAMITGRSATVQKTDGTFEIAGVTSGSYMLRAGDQTGMKSLGPGVPVEIADHPVEGAVIEIAPTSEATGTIAVQGNSESSTPAVSLKGTRIMLEATEGGGLIPPSTNATEDGTFSFKDLAPGRYLVRVMNGPDNSYVDSVRAGNREMSEQGLDLGTGGGGKLDIKLRIGCAQVNGVIKGQDDNPIAGVTVALIPDSNRYLLYQSTFTDQKGAFTFKNVTPGEYKVLAWEDVEPNAFQDPEFVKPFAARAEALSLKENDHKGVTMKAIPRQ
jgi:uncharacterized protein (DUF2141 family)